MGHMPSLRNWWVWKWSIPWNPQRTTSIREIIFSTFGGLWFSHRKDRTKTSDAKFTAPHREATLLPLHALHQNDHTLWVGQKWNGSFGIHKSIEKIIAKNPNMSNCALHLMGIKLWMSRHHGMDFQRIFIARYLITQICHTKQLGSAGYQEIS